LRTAAGATRLRCEGGELLERSEATDCELTLADHVGGLDPGQGCDGGVEGLEAHHRGGDALDEAMILFQDIGEIFGPPDLDGAPPRR